MGSRHETSGPPASKGVAQGIAAWWERHSRPVTRTQWIIDGALTLLFALFVLPFSIVGTAPQVGVLATLILIGAVLLARSLPGTALALAWSAAVLQIGLSTVPVAANIGVLVVLFASAAYGRVITLWLGFASTLLASLIIPAYYVGVLGHFSFPAYADYPFDAIAAYAITLLVISIIALLPLMLAWMLGVLYRNVVRSRAIGAERRRAEQRANIELERGRIARDMHDVVAHSLAVVIAQANGARYASKTDPEAGDRALVTISDTARSALADVRVLLTQLRHQQGDAPQPSLSDLDALFANVRASGTELRVTSSPPLPPVPVPTSVQIALYRILQEALTNTMRHAPGVPVTVGLAWAESGVGVLVANRLPAGAAQPRRTDDGGHGLVGIRERAQLVGGSAASGVEAEFWVVRAQLPMGASRS